MAQRHYQPPKCNAPDQESLNPMAVCNVEMKLMGERHPLWKPGHYVFVCPRCEALRVLDEATLDRYAKRR